VLLLRPLRRMRNPSPNLPTTNPREIQRSPILSLRHPNRSQLHLQEVKRLQVLVLVQDPVLVRDQEAVVRLIREADLVQDLEVVPVLAVVPVPVLVRDLEAALALDPVVVQEVDLEVDRALEVARVPAPLREPMVPERQQELVQLRRDLDPAVALDLVPVRAVVRDLEAALVLAAVPAPAAAPEVALDLDPVRALEVVPALEVVLARDREVPALVLTPVKFGGLEFKRFVRY